MGFRFYFLFLFRSSPSRSSTFVQMYPLFWWVTKGIWEMILTLFGYVYASLIEILFNTNGCCWFSVFWILLCRIFQKWSRNQSSHRRAVLWLKKLMPLPIWNVRPSLRRVLEKSSKWLLKLHCKLKRGRGPNVICSKRVQLFFNYTTNNNKTNYQQQKFTSITRKYEKKKEQPATTKFIHTTK